MKRFNHTKWMILLIGIYCAHESYADSTNKALNLNDTKAVKLEITANDGRVTVREVNGEEMACVMKCFPIKKCRTKATPEEEPVQQTTPIPLEMSDTTDPIESKMSTMSFRSATSSTKKEQAVSAETTTEMSHSTQKETQKIEDSGEHNTLSTSIPSVPINRTSTTGSVANNRPTPFSTHSNAISSSSDLGSLDLATPFEIENQKSQPTTLNPEMKCENDESCGVEFPISQRRHRNKLMEIVPSTTPTKSPSDSETTKAQLTSFESYVHIDLKNQNLRRHSHEDYDIDCDPTEGDSIDSFTKPVDTIDSESSGASKSKPEINLDVHLPAPTTAEKPISISPLPAPAIGESLRRMSDSEEIFTECDSDEAITDFTTSKPTTPTIIPPWNQRLTSITLPPEEVESADQTTTSITRIPESDEMETDCYSDEGNGRFDEPASDQSPTTTQSTPVTEPITNPLVANTLTTQTPNPLTMDELSRRMSEPDADCKNDDNSVAVPPVVNSMRRMSESNENSSDCDSHEDSIELTTEAPIVTDSMRRSSQVDTFTEPNLADPTEYVTECDTEVPIPGDVSNPTNDEHETVGTKTDDALQCCPDSVCLLLYPNVPICDETKAANYLRKMDELRNYFYLYKTQVLITEMVGRSSVYMKKRIDYQRHLVGLWNDTISVIPNNITNSCTTSSSPANVKQIISSIHCVLTYTEKLLNDSLLAMILNVAKRIEMHSASTAALTYPKLRRIIMQSMPKVLNELDTVAVLLNYMLHSQNYENERIFLLELLLDIQQQFETNSEKYLIINAIDSSKSLQENGVGIQMHRTVN